jgi:hypothetical protein
VACQEVFEKIFGGWSTDGKVNDLTGRFVILGKLPAFYFAVVDRPQLHLLRVVGKTPVCTEGNRRICTVLTFGGLSDERGAGTGRQLQSGDEKSADGVNFVSISWPI